MYKKKRKKRLTEKIRTGYLAVQNQEFYGLRDETTSAVARQIGTLDATEAVRLRCRRTQGPLCSFTAGVGLLSRFLSPLSLPILLCYYYRRRASVIKKKNTGTHESRVPLLGTLESDDDTESGQPTHLSDSLMVPLRPHMMAEACSRVPHNPGLQRLVCAAPQMRGSLSPFAEFRFPAPPEGGLLLALLIFCFFQFYFCIACLFMPNISPTFGPIRDSPTRGTAWQDRILTP